MTNQTITPCPLCGTVPEVDAQFDDECKPRCGHIRSPVATIMIDDWTHSCNYELGRACRELDIETVEQLKTRLAPDPRVEVLEIALTKVAESDLSQVPYSQIKAHIEEALFRSQFIAAQRGEVDG